MALDNMLTLCIAIFALHTPHTASTLQAVNPNTDGTEKHAHIMLCNICPAHCWFISSSKSRHWWHWTTCSTYVVQFLTFTLSTLQVHIRQYFQRLLTLINMLTLWFAKFDLHTAGSYQAVNQNTDDTEKYAQFMICNICSANRWYMSSSKYKHWWHWTTCSTYVVQYLTFILSTLQVHIRQYFQRLMTLNNMLTLCYAIFALHTHHTAGTYQAVNTNTDDTEQHAHLMLCNICPAHSSNCM
jgi:hypothetical protein